MVKTLAIRLGDTSNYCLIEAGRVVDFGIWPDTTLPKLSGLTHVLCEVQGVRFVYDEAFAHLDIHSIRDVLADGFGKESESAFTLSRPSKQLIATLRESQYRPFLNQLPLPPLLVCPEYTGLFCALRAKKGDGFYRVSDNSHSLLFVIHDRSLQYHIKETPGLIEILKTRLNLSQDPIDISLADLGLEEAKLPSLVALALYASPESEPSDFLDASQKEHALEPIKLRRSILVGGLIAAVILLSALAIMLWAHGKTKAFKQAELIFSTNKKRYDKAQLLQTEATGLFKDLITLKGTASINGSLTRSITEITQNAPSSITLSAIEQERRTKGVSGFVVSGTAQDMAAVFEYEAALKKGLFKNSKVSDTRKITGTGSQTVVFRININE